ncbi:Cytochrome c1 heme lyase [Actinomortierella ambigua]|uniref:Holocytochrome c-type synthase n=1 Tax=Actinomortierella ambigua TaxID=1343610 RepID=A0A9P6QHS1_9FUNG|nr:Cytochrome c1 heme lyase [Actinomortierella ambigua]
MDKTSGSAESGASAPSKCPVDHTAYKNFLPKDSPHHQTTPQQPSLPTGHPPLPEGHPAVPNMIDADGQPAKCPVSPEAHKYFLPKHSASSSSDAPASPSSSSSSPSSSSSDAPLEIDPTNNMPKQPDQFRTVNQRYSLRTERERSTIPKSESSPDPYGDDKKAATTTGSASSGHSTVAADDNERVWIYPSEQMFFNAMKRKNWSPREEDMKYVVPIHNMVNEMAWRHILRWEKGESDGCGGPKLVRFEGKPKEVTPKARIWSWMGYALPFDRHDWVVDRCGKQVTYIIDFYSGKPDPRYPDAPSFYLDVRPKLSADGAWLRFKKFWFE